MTQLTNGSKPATNDRMAIVVWVARCAVGLGFLMILAVVVMSIARRDFPLPSGPDTEPWYGGVLTAGSVFFLVAIGGYLCLRLPHNALARFMLLAGFGYALHLFATAYTYTSYLTSDGALPLTAAMFILAPIGLALALPSLPFFLLLFPTGRLPSHRWHFAYLVWVYAVVVLGGLSWLSPAGVWVPFDNPLALEGGLGETLGVLGATAWFSVLGLLMLAALSTLVRAIRSQGLERQQFKWLIAAAAFLLAWTLWGLGDSVSPWWYLFNSLGLLAMPLAIAVAVSRYRLWDLDVLIRRTTSYAFLTLLLALVYFGSILVLQYLFGRVTGQNSTAAVVLSTLLIAALFLPLRRRVQGLIDRRFYRRKYDAEQVLSRFAATVRDETDLDALTAELVRVIEETMQPERVTVWLRPESQRRGTSKSEMYAVGGTVRLGGD